MEARTERRGRGTIIIDTRWLGIGGPGRVTELLVRGMLERPERRLSWAAWNGRELSSIDAKALNRSETDPRRRAGQAGTGNVPRGKGLMVFMHQSRPLLGPRNITLMHDTIQLNNARGTMDRTAKSTFLRGIVASSAHIVTVSEWSRGQIVDLLGADPGRVSVLPNPVDDQVAARIGALRDEIAERPPLALFVGRFASHKNLPRLVEAFRASGFAADGGRLALVGGTPDEIVSLTADCEDLRDVELVTSCSQDELEHWYARASLVVQPSIFEGFGLPVAEALAAGI
ncbi:MAG: glycosyltransferase, partial [Thermoleophilia bacterium]